MARETPSSFAPQREDCGKIVHYPPAPQVEAALIIGGADPAGVRPPTKQNGRDRARPPQQKFDGRSYAPNGLKLFVPRRICPRKLDSWPPAGVVRLMKSKTWPSCRP